MDIFRNRIEEKTDEIIEKIISKIGTVILPDIVSIEGVHGSGKTTLCLKLCNLLLKENNVKYINCIDIYNEKETFETILHFLNTSKTTMKKSILMIDDIDKFSKTFIKKITAITQRTGNKILYVFSSIKTSRNVDNEKSILIKTPVISSLLIKECISVYGNKNTERIVNFFETTHNLRKTILFMNYFFTNKNVEHPSFFELSNYVISEWITMETEPINAKKKIVGFLREKNNNNEHIKDVITLVEEQSYVSLEKRSNIIFIEKILDLCNKTRLEIEKNKDIHEFIFLNFINEFEEDVV